MAELARLERLEARQLPPHHPLQWSNTDPLLDLLVWLEDIGSLAS